MLTIREVADRLQVSTMTIRRWWRDGILPAPLRFRRTIRWRTADIDQFLRDKPDVTRTTTRV